LADKNIPTWRQADMPIPLQRQAGHFHVKDRLSYSFQSSGRLTKTFTWRQADIPIYLQRQAGLSLLPKGRLSYSFQSSGRLTKTFLHEGRLICPSAEAGWVSFSRKGRLSYSFQSSGRLTKTLSHRGRLNFIFAVILISEHW
jgi:hypothetical protein